MGGSDVQEFRERGWCPLTITLDDGGLRLSRWSGRERRVSWSDVVGVEWLDANRAVVHTADGDIVLAPRRGEGEALVASLEEHSRPTRHALRDGRVPQTLMARWLGLRDGGDIVCEPPKTLVGRMWSLLGGSTSRRLFWLRLARFIILAGFLITLAEHHWWSAAWTLVWIGLFGGIELTLSRFLDSRVPTVRANAAWLTVSWPDTVFRCHWSEVTRIEVDEKEDTSFIFGNLLANLVTLDARGQTIRFPVCGRGQKRLRHALRRYGVALRSGFAAAGAVPPSDAALSRMTGEESPDDGRGLSRTSAS